MRRIRGTAVLVVVALAALGTPAAQADIPAPPSQWYKLPGLNAASGAQWVRAFAHSTPPNIVYAGLEGGGVYRSTNGGATWSAFNSGFPNPLITNVRALLASSTGTEVLAGTDDGVWKSTGGNWERLGQGPGPNKLNGSVQSLISLPGGTLLAGVASGGVWKSTDGGDTWKPPAPGNGMPSYETPYGFVGHPGPAPVFILSASSNGIFRSSDQGDTWTLTSDGIPGSASPIQAWVDTSQPNLMYASTGSNGIYRSINGGVTWAEINNGLGAVRARGFQIFTADEGAHLYAATEDGLWHGLNTHAAVPPPPEWDAVTQEGLHESSPVAHNVIMWSLTAPVIPGAGALGLIAGTQSNGGYFLSFEPPDSICPLNNTTNTTANCPRVNDTTPVEEQTILSVLGNGNWTGTGIIEYAYQWQRCTGTAHGDCTDITDAEESTYPVPNTASAARYRLEVTATNPAPTFDTVVRYSAITAVAAPNPGNAPGANQVFVPDITVIPTDHATSPTVGDQLYAEYGAVPNPPTHDGFFNPPATNGVSFQWLRCNNGTADCNEIPGANARTYTLTSADGTHQLRVRATGTNDDGVRTITSAASYDVISAPAAVADPIPDPDGGPAKSQAPMIAGNAWVGETLAGTVGGWKDPTTEFQRRWVRCDADGNACTYIQEVASTDAETGSTYVVRPDDIGYTIRMRVTADVNGDFTDNPIDDHLPRAVEVDTPPSAVVTNKPVPAPPGGGGGPAPGGGGGGGGGPTVLDRIAPRLTSFSVTNKTFAVASGQTAVSARAKKGTTFRFVLSEAGTARITIAQLLPGRKVGRKCVKPSRKNSKRKKCTRTVTRGTLTRRNLPAARASVPFTGRIGKKKLPVGKYRATVAATDAAGNKSKAATVDFKVVRR